MNTPHPMKTDQTIASDEINSAPSVEETARAAADVIAERSGVARHDIALVLGSGWAGAADILGEEVYSIPAPQVPGFRPPALEGHVGTLRSIRIGETGRHALVLGARTHLYEGHGVDAVAHGVRTAAAAGCRVLVLTNGAGGLDPEHGQGSVYVLRDHINLTGATPLRGATFIDMTDLYSPRLRDIARRVEPELVDGVYVAMHGPQFETPAEVRMAGILGGDLVGMSTALEAIAARASAMEVLGLSLVTNLASGVGAEKLAHADVLEAGKAAGDRLAVLLRDIVTVIASELEEPDAGQR